MNMFAISTVVALVLFVLFLIVATFFRQFYPQFFFFAFGFVAVILTPLLFFVTRHTSSGLVKGLALFHIIAFILLYLFLMVGEVKTSGPTSIEVPDEASDSVDQPDEMTTDQTESESLEKGDQ